MSGSLIRHQEKTVREVQVQVQVSHPNIGHVTDGPDDIVTRLAITDNQSRKLLIEVDLTAADFHRMLASKVTSDTCTARVIDPKNYQYVGQEMHHFTRHFSIREAPPIEVLRDWAESVRAGLSLHSASAVAQNNGKQATWCLYVDGTPEYLADIQDAIDKWAPPAGGA
jgi:hypothetical protein